MSNPVLANKIIPIHRPPVVGDIPYSKEAEEAVIGACLINPNAFVECRDILETPHAFYFIRHDYIWAAMEHCYNSESLMDVLVISERLKATGHLDEIGGPAYLTQLIRNVPTSVHAPVYARLVRRLMGRRQIIQYADSLKALASDETTTLDDLIDEHAKLRVALDRMSETPLDPVGVSDLPAYHELVLTARDNPDKARGISTGFPDLDEKLSGWQQSRLVEVGGFVHMGKTATLQAFAVNAVKHKIPVLYFNVADSTKQDIMARMIASLSGVPSDVQLGGRMSAPQFDAYMKALFRYEKWPLHIHDEIGMTTRKLAATVRSMKRQNGIRLVIIDYYQELQIDGRFTGRYEMLDRISQELLAIAKENALPVIVGAQVRKEIEKREDKRPHLNDTAECKRLEDRADVVIFVHREQFWNPLCDLPEGVEFLIRKNRQVGQGGIGFVNARFVESTGAIVPGQVRYVQH